MRGTIGRTKMPSASCRHLPRTPLRSTLEARSCPTASARSPSSCSTIPTLCTTFWNGWRRVASRRSRAPNERSALLFRRGGLGRAFLRAAGTLRRLLLLRLRRGRCPGGALRRARGRLRLLACDFARGALRLRLRSVRPRFGAGSAPARGTRLPTVGVLGLPDQLLGFVLGDLAAAHHVLHEIARTLDGEAGDPRGRADHVL